jgi:hypothetical protein
VRLVHRRRIPRFFLAALAAVAAMACGEQRPDSARDSAANAGEDPETRFRAQLGRTWELAQLGDQGIPPSPARAATRSPGMHPGPGTRPTIRFTAERLPTAPPDSAFASAGGWSFCNGYGAGYVVGPGDQLRFHQFHSTLVGCHGPDSLETRFFRALSATRRFALGADKLLLLIAEDGSRLAFVASPDSAGAPRVAPPRDQ